jgi:hypothetical protein
MRKLVVLVALVVAGALIGRRLRSRGAASAPPLAPTPPAPAPRAPVPASAPPPAASPVAEQEPEPPAASGPPPATTNGERVVLMSVQSLTDRDGGATQEAVVAKVAAGDIDPDEGTVEVLLHRLVAAGCLDGGDAGPYRLTSLGQAALLDGSSARPSAAGDAADELATPAADA